MLTSTTLTSTTSSIEYFGAHCQLCLARGNPLAAVTTFYHTSTTTSSEVLVLLVVQQARAETPPNRKQQYLAVRTSSGGLWKLV